MRTRSMLKKQAESTLRPNNQTSRLNNQTVEDVESSVSSGSFSSEEVEIISEVRNIPSSATSKTSKFIERFKLYQAEGGESSSAANHRPITTKDTVCYRSSLTKIRKIVQKTTSTLRLQAFRRTPFYHMIYVFSEVNLPATIKKPNIAVLGILKSFDFNKMKFKISGSDYCFTPNDFKLIFGIVQTGNAAVNISGFTAQSYLRTKYFSTLPRLTATSIEQAIISVSNTDDYVCLMCVLIISKIFTAETCWINWQWLSFVANIDSLKNYDWCKFFSELLLNQIKKNQFDLLKVQGCTVFLLYWFCELSDSKAPKKLSRIPRFAKWNIASIGEAFENNPYLLRNVEGIAEDFSGLIPTDEERSLFFLADSPAENAIVLYVPDDLYVPDHNDQVDDQVDDHNDQVAENAIVLYVPDDLYEIPAHSPKSDAVPADSPKSDAVNNYNLISDNDNDEISADAPSSGPSNINHSVGPSYAIEIKNDLHVDNVKMQRKRPRMRNFKKWLNQSSNGNDATLSRVEVPVVLPRWSKTKPRD